MRRQRAAASRARLSSTRRRFFATCLAFAALAGGTACDPTFNWREIRSPEGFAVALPGRSQTVSREIKLLDATVQMSMTSTGIGPTLFAVGAAQLPPILSGAHEARLRTLAHVRDAMVRNVNGSLTANPTAVLVVPAGDPRHVLEGEAIEATGRDAGGRAVQLAARLFIVDDRLFQVVAMGAEGGIPRDALETFFTSFRLI